MIYLDYQATTPLAPQAREAMMPWLEEGFGNPHSPHRMGREAAAAVAAARAQVAALLPADGRLAFTSGATEALNWAIKGLPGAIVTIATEHAAVLDTVGYLARQGSAVTILPVDDAGLVDMDAADRAIGPGVGAVVAMLVNNEIGVIQPIPELSRLARRAGAALICDAVQGYGRVAVPDGCDLVAISAHKVHGPKGIGGLWVRDGLEPEPLMHGGGQEAGGRSGTLSPALCAGFGAAAALMDAGSERAHAGRLRDRLLAALGRGWIVNGALDPRWPGNLNLRHEGIDAARLISELRDIAFSAGSACASGSGRPSHVLRALGLSDAEARASIRLGFGRYTTPDEIDRAAAAITEAVARQMAWA